MFPVLYSPYEPEHFLGFFTSWIRIRIRICPCGFGSETLQAGITFVVGTGTVFFISRAGAGVGAEAGAKKRKKSDGGVEPKLNAFGSATLL